VPQRRRCLLRPAGQAQDLGEIDEGVAVGVEEVARRRERDGLAAESLGRLDPAAVSEELRCLARTSGMSACAEAYDATSTGSRDRQRCPLQVPPSAVLFVPSGHVVFDKAPAAEGQS